MFKFRRESWGESISERMLFFYGLKIENGRPADVQGETAYLTHHFAATGLVPIILGAPRNKLGDDVSVQFIRHVPEKIPGGNAGLTGTTLVHHTICIVVKDLLLKGV